MVEFARSEFALNVEQDDGKTLRDHLMSLWRQTKEKPEQLANAPELPELAAHVWGWFLELHNERGSSGMAPSRITSQAMQGWCWATGNVLALWERAAIRAVDTAWMKAPK